MLKNINLITKYGSGVYILIAVWLKKIVGFFQNLPTLVTVNFQASASNAVLSHKVDLIFCSCS